MARPRAQADSLLVAAVVVAVAVVAAVVASREIASISCSGAGSWP
jgi:hypothetical protein